MIGAFFLGQIPLILEELARGGGGGSSAGGGGGSSGSSSSGGGGAGGIFVLVGLVGYVPLHFLGAQLRKYWYGKDTWRITQAIGWSIVGLVVVAILVLVPVFGSLLLTFYGLIPVAIGAVIGMAAGLYAAFPKVAQTSKMRKALGIASSNDTVWNEKNVLKYVEGIFYKFQQDWTKFDIASMKQYLSPHYHGHITLMMQALHDAHRINKVMSPQVLSSVIATVHDADNNDEDMFEVAFTATANDQLYDDRTDTLLFRDTSTFTEYWRFVRQGNNWLFDGIRQDTQNDSKTRSEIAQFAEQNGMYYSADWGWLLLPADGYLFNHGKFGTSDINNHAIGLVNNVLVQLYTYAPDVNAQTDTGIDKYLVVQTHVPKDYGRILVRRRSKFINWPVKGLTQIKMEWGEFNDMYDVYASDLERVTSFELLNPAFMANLRDLPLAVNIEVVNNVVYLFAQAKSDVASYKIFYDILLKAHKEMKL